MTDFDVIVVGFGPAGVIAIGMLGQAGLRTLAIDRSTKAYGKPRAIAIDHEIMRTLQNMGVAEAVLPHVAPFPASEHYGVDGPLIRRIEMVEPRNPLGYVPTMVFTQPLVEVAGLLADDTHPARGTLLTQPWVQTADGRRRLDEQAGIGWRIVWDGRKAEPVAADGLRSITVGGPGLPETEGVLTAWFDRNACAAAIIRQDHCI